MAGLRFSDPNQDGSGVVDAVGEGVDPARVSERVWVYFAAWRRPWATAAEHTVVPTDRAVPLPETASFELGASIGIPAMTAHQCLLADGPVEGKTLLVSGGAGAVGRAAIELARWLGAARVLATVSSDEKAEIALAAGADATINYKDHDAIDQARELAAGQVERIVELALGQNLELDLAVAAANCSIATYAHEGSNPQLDVSRVMPQNIALRVVLVYTMAPEAIAAAVADVTRAVAAGALTEPRLHRFSLEQAANAHDAVEAGRLARSSWTSSVDGRRCRLVPLRVAWSLANMRNLVL